MDAAVARAAARWPDVPAVYGWLALDRRGAWRLRNPVNGSFERIGNAALRAFIARNYAFDADGAWYFQNGPQRVYLRLERTPLVYRALGDGFEDHCGRAARDLRCAAMDEQGDLYVCAAQGAGVVDDRDLHRAWAMLEDCSGRPPRDDFDWSAAASGELRLRLADAPPLPLERVRRDALEARFGYVADPRPETAGAG